MVVQNDLIPLENSVVTYSLMGWLGGAMVLGKLPVPGRPTIWIPVGQGEVGWCDGAG